MITTTPVVKPSQMAWIEDIPVHGFETVTELLNRFVAEIEKPDQSVIHYLNVHVANQAVKYPWLKRLLRKGDIVFCDGAGIVLASKLLGQPLPTRHTAADWFIPLMDLLAKKGHRVYLLGGDPGVAEETVEVLSAKLDEHPVVGFHHGYILNDDALEQEVIEAINRLKPDLLIVGFGTPLQEFWIDSNRHVLDVSAIMGLGAVMDFISGKVNRCPQWMGEMGFEWLYRLSQEPGRMFDRYVYGNPWFLSRIVLQVLKQRFSFKSSNRPLTTP